MEGMSIEDNGEALKFHIYVPNIQPDVNIDYSNGLSWTDVPEVEAVEQPVLETVPEVVEQPVEIVEQPVAEEPPRVQESVFYQNCTAVRAAGADPIRTGDPGWDTKFDRDGEGVGCE